MSDLFTVRNFHKEHPFMHKNLQALKFEVANRDKNGLMDAGAIIEK